MNAMFGPAGNADCFPGHSSLEAPDWLAGLGLDCYEFQCGRGVKIQQDAAEKLGDAAKKAGIVLSLHAPYFINLANPDPKQLQKTIKYILDACRAAHWMGAGRVVIHTGALMKRSRQEAMETARASMLTVLQVWEQVGLDDITLCPETMGKINQLGDLTEVLQLCQLDERLLPCVDFGHLYARSLGKLTGAEAYRQILDEILQMLGETRARRFHAHFSRIEFTLNGGEKRHRTFADHGEFGPEPAPLMAEVARRGWTPTFICESAGTQAKDALELKRLYQCALTEHIT